MAHPGASDKCEWFELYNPHPTDFCLQDCQLLDMDNLNSPHDIVEELIVGAGEYVVLGRTPDDALPCLQGFDYAYVGIKFTNSGDRIELRCGGQTIDEVEFDGAWGFEGPTNKGQSRQLKLGTISGDEPDIANDDVDQWCWAPKIAELKIGDLNQWGTPGAESECY